MTPREMEKKAAEVAKRIDDFYCDGGDYRLQVRSVIESALRDMGNTKCSYCSKQEAHLCDACINNVIREREDAAEKRGEKQTRDCIACHPCLVCDEGSSAPNACTCSYPHTCGIAVLEATARREGAAWVRKAARPTLVKLEGCSEYLFFYDTKVFKSDVTQDRWAALTGEDAT